MPKSRLTLTKEGNDDLTELMDGREPNESVCFKIYGRILDNTSQEASIAIDEVESMADDRSEDKKDADEKKHDYTDPEDHIGMAVDSAMSSSK